MLKTTQPGGGISGTVQSEPSGVASADVALTTSCCVGGLGRELELSPVSPAGSGDPSAALREKGTLTGTPLRCPEIRKGGELPLSSVLQASAPLLSLSSQNNGAEVCGRGGEGFWQPDLLLNRVTVGKRARYRSQAALSGRGQKAYTQLQQHQLQHQRHRLMHASAQEDLLSLTNVRSPGAFNASRVSLAHGEEARVRPTPAAASTFLRSDGWTRLFGSSGRRLK